MKTFDVTFVNGQKTTVTAEDEDGAVLRVREFGVAVKSVKVHGEKKAKPKKAPKAKAKAFSKLTKKAKPKKPAEKVEPVEATKDAG